MRFAWPYALLGLLLAPALLAAYVWQFRRRRRSAVAYSSVALLRKAAPRLPGWRRHLPVALVVGALACLAAAAARPQVRMDVPVSGSAVILALDVSGSMCATDVEPNRLSAAQDAVRAFVKRQDGSTRVGLVVFSGFAELAVLPTTDRATLLESIDSLTTGRGTTIGAAILKSIDAIAEIDHNVRPSGTDTTDAGPDDATPTPTPAPSAPGGAAKAPEIVVLLTDGANTRGTTPEDAAKVAAARGVRVYPIGFGTDNPTSLVCTSKQIGSNSYGGFGPNGNGGRGIPSSALVADDDALRTVATTTGGEFFKAQDAGQLQGVLKDLPSHVETQTKDVEVSAGLVGAGVLLVLLAFGAAVRWSAFPR